MISNDTIAAIATATGDGGIAIVRISGPQALAIADRVFRCKGPSPTKRSTHTITWGQIITEGQIIDEGLLLIMRAPKSYTREDVVELHGHGGTVTPKLVLRAALQAGARPAEPGEFTYRAFINGRMDLVQAESVNDLIRAQSDRAAHLAVEQMEGHLSRQFNNIYQNLVAIAADLEATLDFPDDELPPPVLPEIIIRIDHNISKINELLNHWQDGHRLREGLAVVIAGRPNVGKSSLLNALLGKNRAIVSHQPGTTRDFIEEQYVLAGVPLRIVDTAGLREATCAIEQEGVRRTRDQIQRADFYLYLLDASVPLHDADIENIEKLPKDRCILVLNKIDLGNAIQNDFMNCWPKAEISVKNATGIENVKELLSNMMTKFIHLESMPEAIISERHYHHLNTVVQELKNGMVNIKTRRDPLISAHHIRQAIRAIGAIIGCDATEDILSSIFSKFCVGK